MSQVDRTVPNWGKAHPLPELEAVLAEVNQHRQAKPKNWFSIRGDAYSKAARILGLRSPADTGGGDSWNPFIEAMTQYRADWRGYVVRSPGGRCV